jgi:hypothetical protein
LRPEREGQRLARDRRTRPWAFANRPAAFTGVGVSWNNERREQSQAGDDLVGL